MINPLHLVLGDSAAGCLRVACQSCQLPGTVIGIRDDLSHGPLNDGLERLNYMRACYGEEGDWLMAVADAFEPWQKLIESIKRDEPEAIMIWRGVNVSEITFLAMACWQFRKLSTPLFQVLVPREDELPYVATHMPIELAALYPGYQDLTNTDRDHLSKDFERIRRETGLLRRWEHGQVVGVSSDYYDRFLEESCSSDWLSAARVIGTAMSRCDNNNLMSDLFFFSRLRLLVDAGRIEADGKQKRLRDCTVRLAKGID